MTRKMTVLGQYDDEEPAVAEQVASLLMSHQGMTQAASDEDTAPDEDTA